MTWARYAERRAGRSVYAVDTIGEVGRSRQEVAVENAAALASWLDEVLAGLGLDEVHLAGTSYGGFLALNLAARRPARVRTVFVIEPAGVVRVRLGRFMAWGWCVLLSSLLPGPPRRVAAKWLRMPALEDRRLLRLGFYAARHHRKRLLRPEPLTDEQLRSITVPVTVVVGAKSEVFPPREVVARAALLPKVEVEIVDGAGHAAADSHVDQIASRLLGFAAR
jgi:pimeloyl-ACP methyl ester carboxylesterase